MTRRTAPSLPAWQWRLARGPKKSIVLESVCPHGHVVRLGRWEPAETRGVSAEDAWASANAYLERFLARGPVKWCQLCEPVYEAPKSAHKPKWGDMNGWWPPALSEVQAVQKKKAGMESEAA